MGPSGGLPAGLRRRLFLASLGLQASWNPQRMQNLGLLSVMLVWLEGLPRVPDRDRLFCRRYYEFFNTNPYLANYLIGGLVRLEEAREAGADLPRGLAATVRDSLGRALASLGDQLFWLGLRPALVMGTAWLGLHGRVAEILAVAGLFAVAQLLLRWRALDRGYRAGMEIVDELSHPGWHRAVAVATRAGMVLTGTVAACYLTRARGVAGGDGGLLALVGAALGLCAPLVLRRRPPGEVLVLLALAAAVALTFAEPLARS